MNEMCDSCGSVGLYMPEGYHCQVCIEEYDIVLPCPVGYYCS